MVNNLNLNKDMVMKVAIDAYSKGLASAKDVLADARTYLADKISCESVFDTVVCIVHAYNEYKEGFTDN